MKRLFLLAFLGIGITGCSVESLDSTENLSTADSSTSISSFSLTPPDVICSGLPAVFKYSAPLKSNLQVQQLVGSDWVQVYHNNKSNNDTEEFVLTFATPGTYYLRYKNEQGFSAPVTINVINCSTCEESFSYTYNEEKNSYLFTYVSAESTPENSPAVLIFTFPQAIASESLIGWTINGQTYQKSMAIVACKIYSWEVKFIPNCNSPNSNLFTDFKVNNISKKGDLANIVASCI